MKIVRHHKTGLLSKARNDQAKKLVEGGDYSYSTKSAFKAQFKQLKQVLKNQELLRSKGIDINSQEAHDRMYKDSQGDVYYSFEFNKGRTKMIKVWSAPKAERKKLKKQWAEETQKSSANKRDFEEKSAKASKENMPKTLEKYKDQIYKYAKEGKIHKVWINRGTCFSSSNAGIVRKKIVAFLKEA